MNEEVRGWRNYPLNYLFDLFRKRIHIFEGHMEFYYNKYKRRFEPVYKMDSRDEDPNKNPLIIPYLEALKNPHRRATEFVKVKNHYPGEPYCQSAYIYYNISDFGFFIGNKFIFYYTLPNMKLTSAFDSEKIINYKKWKAYFADKENPEIAKIYFEDLRILFSSETFNYKERANLKSHYETLMKNISPGIKLYLELNKGE